MLLNNNDLRGFCESLVLSAGKVLLEFQDKFKIVNKKDLQDIATDADMASEKLIINKILERYPDHGIISEESGEINSNANYVWIIDPLDGTKEFIRGVPQWNCSICLMRKGQVIVSAIYRPYEDVLYSSVNKNGSFKNKRRINVSNCQKLEESFIYCYLPSYKRNRDKYDWAFGKLNEIGKKAYRLRAMADENSALCWLAQGGCEAYVNLANPPKMHDIFPGLSVAKEAGAYCIGYDIPLIVANNKKIYNELSKIIYDN